MTAQRGAHMWCRPIKDGRSAYRRQGLGRGRSGSIRSCSVIDSTCEQDARRGEKARLIMGVQGIRVFHRCPYWHHSSLHLLSKSLFGNIFSIWDTSQMNILSKHYLEWKNELFRNMIMCVKCYLGPKNASQLQILLGPSILSRLYLVVTSHVVCVTCVIHWQTCMWAMSLTCTYKCKYHCMQIRLFHWRKDKKKFDEKLNISRVFLSRKVWKKSLNKSKP